METKWSNHFLIMWISIAMGNVDSFEIAESSILFFSFKREKCLFGFQKCKLNDIFDLRTFATNKCIFCCSLFNFCSIFTPSSFVLLLSALDISDVFLCHISVLNIMEVQHSAVPLSLCAPITIGGPDVKDFSSYINIPLAAKAEPKESRVQG